MSILFWFFLLHICSQIIQIMIFASLTVILVCIVDILILIIVNKYMKDVSLVEFFYNVSYHCGLSPGTVGALLNST